MSETVKHILDTDQPEWLRSLMAEKQEQNVSNQLEGPKIPKVPKTLREVEMNKDCYDPSVVSIGPYHHGKPELKEMEDLKVTFACQFKAPEATDSMAESAGKVLEALVEIEEMVSKETTYNVVEREAKEARQWYDSTTRSFDDQKFVQMMFLDGCFILHCLSCIYLKPENPMMSSHQAALVAKDLLLLENQLPFKVLVTIWKCYRKGRKIGGIKLLRHFCNHVRAFPTRREFNVIKFLHVLLLGNRERFDLFANSAHLLELFHRKFVDGECPPVSPRQKDPQTSWNHYYLAEELWGAGIHFKPSNTSDFNDIQFKPRLLLTGTLYVPPLRIDNTTKSILLNMIAYEACNGTPNNWATSYACFMDSLIDHPGVVKVLRSYGILLNTPGSDHRAAELFNDMASHLKPNPRAFMHVKSSIE